MSTEQINIRIDSELVAALDRVAREESLDRATTIRRLLDTSVRQWERERALRGYQLGELSVGRAAEEAGLSQWELLDAARAAGIAHPLTGEDAERRLARITADAAKTLPDRPPARGGVLLVGINPAPVSVAAGHYYQGRLGRRLWRRLERVGLLRDPLPGAEDDAFVGEGHGLTDLVKRPTVSARELTEEELSHGMETLRNKVREWQPGLILFAFREPAARLLGPRIAPGPGPAFEGVPTFLLSGPYAPRSETERIDAELRRILRRGDDVESDGAPRTQRVTANDLRVGQIRLPRDAKALLPPDRRDVDIVLRGVRLVARYDPRVGRDRERSAVLRVARDRLRNLVREGDVLRVTRGPAGVVVLK